MVSPAPGSSSPGGGGGGRLGSILDGMCEQRKWVLFQLQANGINEHISIQNGCHIGLVIQYGYHCLYFPFRMSHIFYSIA